MPKDKDKNIFPIDFYKLFITDDVLDLIVLTTNIYAEQEKENHAVAQRSCLAQWKDVTSEVLNFLEISYIWHW